MRRIRRLASHPASTPIIVQFIHGQTLSKHLNLLAVFRQTQLSFASLLRTHTITAPTMAEKNLCRLTQTLTLITAILHMLAPDLIGQIPFHRFSDARFKRFLRRPAQLLFNLACINGITHIMTRAIGDVGDEIGIGCRSCCTVRCKM